MTKSVRKLAAIVFTDIANYSELAGQDEDAALALLARQRACLRPLVDEHGGNWVKEFGDGLLLSFPSSIEAIQCVERMLESTRSVQGLNLRIGVHQAGVVHENGDLLGNGVNIANRLEQLSPVGGAAFSEAVEREIHSQGGFDYVSLGTQQLKGIEGRREVYCLRNGLPNIPNFDLVRRIGSGAYGEVWLARTLTGAYRAVKIVHKSTFEKDRPFEREFEGVRQYADITGEHESLIKLFHVGQDDRGEFFYYEMELADGRDGEVEIDPMKYQARSLQTVIQDRQQLPISECRDIGIDLARALEFLHEQQLVHRDIKPANIVYVNGRPKLADIGLVADLRADNTRVGTAGYDPPEGSGKPVGDIYSLGKVLYVISTGNRPEQFPELPRDSKDSIRAKELRGINQVYCRACENNPENRFKNAGEMAAELTKLTLASPAPGRATLIGAAAVIAAVGWVYFPGDEADKPGGTSGESTGSPATNSPTAVSTNRVNLPSSNEVLSAPPKTGAGELPRDK